MSKSNDVYCLAPWVHAYLNTQGKRDFCCFKDFSLEKTTDHDRLSLEEYWNGDEIKDARLKMLSGKAPESCYPCSSRVLYNQHPRNFFFDKYEYLRGDIQKYTDAVGKTSLKPRFLDYRFSNKCNFSCRMCSPGASSKIEAIERKYRANDFPQKSFLDERRDFNEQFALQEFKGLVKDGALDQIYWGGGEPLVTEEHWELMQYCIDTGFSKEIDITYNTNLSVLTYRHFELIEMIKHFKSVKFLISLDGVSEIGEYIREGLSWDKMKKNLTLIKGITKSKVKLTITITLPGLFGLRELASFILENDYEYDVHICHANGPHDLLSPLILPRGIINSLVDRQIDDLKAFKDTRITDLIDNVSILKKQKTIQENFPENFDRRFFACRDYYLKKEPKNKLNLEKILRNDKATYDWWFRDKPRVAAADLNNYEKKIFSLQTSFISEMGDTTQLVTDPNIISSELDKLEELETAQSIKDKTRRNLIISNDHKFIQNEKMAIDEMTKAVPSGGVVSLILPAKSVLNRWANRRNLDSYKNKVRLDKRLSEGGIEGFEIVLKRSITPWSLIFPWKGLSLVLDFITMILIRFGFDLCIHRQWILKRK